MADALRQYWYLGIALIATVILTLWVIKKAAQASSRAHAEREAQMKKLEYESGVLKNSPSSAKRSSAMPTASALSTAWR